MNFKVEVLFILLTIFSKVGWSQQSQDLRLWYKQPATILIKNLPQIQELLAQGEVLRADSIYKHSGYLQFNGATSVNDFGAYQPLGDIQLKFYDQGGAVSNYIRDLNLAKSTAGVRYC
jgi:hypothetical protein